ncbi:MAG: serine/threonine-protein kinase HipA [Verrucomicrobiales bacterium]|jgi:serine/threonine-protein kinase HipA
MSDLIEVADVMLWSRRIGAIAWNAQSETGAFEYDPTFRASGIEVAPLMMPLGDRIYRFPELARDSYKGLPGMIADSLPDRFGNLLINQWLAQQGRPLHSFSPVERICYIGSRGMGALEFQPSLRLGKGRRSQPLDVAVLVELAQRALTQKESLHTHLEPHPQPADPATEEALQEIILVGTSAGGARAKAVIAWNPQTHEVHSGQVECPDGFEHWLLKLDGLSGNKDKETADPAGYGKIEYAYHLMARAAGITMADCQLYEENGRHHFMTRRFDRTATGKKLHMQSLCGMAHFDFNQAGAFGYEQALQVMQQLELPRNDLEQQLRRMIFNVAARNQDDHTKNIAFLMDQSGTWSLAPAFDVTYAYNPNGEWTQRHQMTINGKREAIDRSDFEAIAKRFRIKKPLLTDTIADVAAAIQRWSEFAALAEVSPLRTEAISRTHQQF